VSKLTTNPRPPKSVRDELRRAEIVAGARECVVRHGFHAASMAEISAATQLSVGQIYRYFPSKEAIIEAIVLQIVERKIARVSGKSDEAQFPRELALRTVEDADGDDQKLLLDATAEATRNPAVAEIVRRADRALHDRIREFFRARFPAMSEAQARARVEVLAVLVDGTRARKVTDPVADPQVLELLYVDVLEMLFPLPAPPHVLPPA